MKYCVKCSSHLDEGHFYKCSSSKDGLFWICKECAKKYAKYCRNKNSAQYKLTGKKWKHDNKQKQLETVRKWRRNHPSKAKEIAIKWQKENPEKKRKSNLKWRKNNQHFLNELSAARRAICGMATPKWANKFFMKEIYHLARLRTELTGIKWHVDHVIPLNGKYVCGLHVETNMQVIPWIENVRKSNKF